MKNLFCAVDISLNHEIAACDHINIGAIPEYIILSHLIRTGHMAHIWPYHMDDCTQEPEVYLSVVLNLGKPSR